MSVPGWLWIALFTCSRVIYRGALMSVPGWLWIALFTCSRVIYRGGTNVCSWMVVGCGEVKEEVISLNT